VPGDAGLIVNELEIQAFWATHPCGEQLVGGVRNEDYESFFSRYDDLRYKLEPHIPGCLDRIRFEGREVLEVGLGLGSDSEQIIRRGARWTGIDLTGESVARVRTRLGVRGLAYRDVVHGSVVALPFPDNAFDVVFSHGVLHHVPDIRLAQSEIARVLRPDGEAIVMVYAKHSLNYWLSIAVLRRFGLLAVYGLTRYGIRVRGIYGAHVENAHSMGLARYLRLENFVHRNTDGPLNPYSKVYSLADARHDFPSFEIVAARKEFMHAPPLPVHRLPFARVAGWHLWLHLRPIGVTCGS